jgi:hypothetical protein
MGEPGDLKHSNSTSIINPPCRLYRQKRTSPDDHGMSVLCQKATSTFTHSSVGALSLPMSPWTSPSSQRSRTLAPSKVKKGVPYHQTWRPVG